MLPIPQDVLTRFDKVLRQREVPEPLHAYYRKWLRYFLDFYKKYPPPDAKSEQMRLFIEKLRAKKQTPQQCTQAAHALSLFFESQLPKNDSRSAPVEATPSPIAHAQPAHQSPKAREAKSAVDPAVVSPAPMLSYVAEPPPTPSPFSPTGGRRFNEWRCLEKSKSPEWDQAICKLAAEIKTRHYSRKTLKTYADWGRKFQRYLRNKPPEELSAEDVKEYLTLSCREMPCCLLDPESGLQCPAVSFPACPQEGLRRSTGCAPRKEIEIYSRGSLPAGNRCGYQAP